MWRISYSNLQSSRASRLFSTSLWVPPFLPSQICACSAAVIETPVGVKAASSIDISWFYSYLLRPRLTFKQRQICNGRKTYLSQYYAPLQLLVRTIVVCLSVCPLAHLKNHTAELHQIFVHVACGRGSVLSRRRRDTLYRTTSGFVDDVVFSRNGPSNASRVASVKLLH